MQIFIKVFGYFLKQSSDLPRRLENWIRIRVFREHLKYVVIGHHFQKTEKKIAIFAIYPGTSPLSSVLRMLKTLKANEFQILAVINSNVDSKKYISALSKNDCTILVRSNVGSDFGAYQTGMRYLKQQKLYQLIESLILVNDSIFVSKTSEESISRIASSSNATNCIFLHREGVLHAASMFLKFDKQILMSRKFIKFWDKYFPYSNKRKVIKFGEHKLTKVVGVDYFVPYVSLETISNKRKIKLLSSERLQMLTWSHQASRNSYVFISESLKQNDESSAISYSVFNLHLSNSLGLYLNRVYGVPLKMDLVLLGVVSPLDFLQALRRNRCTPDEMKELMETIQKKGSFATRSLLSRLSDR